MPTLDEVTISKRAYEIWESQGRPHGRDRDHWLQAAAELSAPAPGIAKPARRIAEATVTPPRTKAAPKAKLAPAKLTPAKKK